MNRLNDRRRTGGGRVYRIAAAGLMMTCGCQMGRPAPFQSDPLLHHRGAIRGAAVHAPVEGFVRLPMQPALVPHPPAAAHDAGSSLTFHADPAPVTVVPDSSSEPLPRPAPLPADEPVWETPLPLPAVLPEGPNSWPEPVDPDFSHGPAISETVTASHRDDADADADGTTGGPTHAAGGDYRWLRGVIDRHYAGHASLRYRPASEDDRWGGKVHLLPHPDLERFQDGDVVYVEGELTPDEVPEGLEGRADYPGYRVRLARPAGG